MPNNSAVSKESAAGFAPLITDLPVAGKTPLGRALITYIEKESGRQISLRDRDEVHKPLSLELEFSREHRRLNALRHGYIAAEVCRHGGIAACSLIAPYAANRAEMRQLVTRHGSFDK